MRENRLAPFTESSLDPSGKLPAERAKAQLERHTRYWPMIISQTTILNMQAVRTEHRFLLLLTSAHVTLSNDQNHELIMSHLCMKFRN